MNLLLLEVLSFAFTRTALGGLEELVVVQVTQDNHFHVSQSDNQLQGWREELYSITKESPVVLATHEMNLEGAAWTIVPLLPNLTKYKRAKWFLFVSEVTRINFISLEDMLASFDPSQELFLGHALTDTQPTIIHHFTTSGSISYPNFPSGFVLSATALQKASEFIGDFKLTFNIDPQYEFAMFLKYHQSLRIEELAPTPLPAPPTAILLTHIPQFCLSSLPAPSDGSCATTYQQNIPNCSDKPEVTLKDIHFAVKTYSKFHSTRLPIVWQTWAPDAGESITYYSDIEDNEYSTIDIGVPNTERGHCGKTFAIIKKFYSDSKSAHGILKWLVIADDDTLLSVPRLLRLLQCYDHTHPILLGEAYGYGAQWPQGITFITGGGGMVLSLEAVNSLIESEQNCPSIESPDDMYLGSVAKQLHWNIIHSPLFHQSQPPSFPEAILKVQLQSAISFHRHNPLNPVVVYANYLKEQPHGMDYEDHTQTEMDYEEHKSEL